MKAIVFNPDFTNNILLSNVYALHFALKYFSQFTAGFSLPCRQAGVSLRPVDIV
jgi:hypothetical protein